MAHAPGDPIRVEVTKWGERPHWRFDGLWLGSDEHGEWLGFPVGTPHARPGYSYDSQVASVTLVPHIGHWLATFHAPGIWCDLYVDMCTPATWDGDVLRTIDLDLDVIRMSSTTPDAARPPGILAGPGELFVDDEDEFLEHQVAYGYPDEVVSAARSAADEVLAAVAAGTAAYDGSHARWLRALVR